MTIPRLFAASVAALVLAATAGCSTTPAQPLVLHIGTNDTDATNVADEIRHLAELIDRASGGSIVVEPEWRAGGSDVPRWDQNVAERVIEGDLELGMVPSRAWDVLGVTSLRALNAPFVVTSDQALVGATSAAIQDPILEGLAGSGVVGLDLFPESLRHPNSLSSEPLLGPDDYAGVVIRAPYSETTVATFAALGAEVDDSSPDPDKQAGMETSYVRSAGPVITSNVTFSGKFDVFVVNQEVWDSLTDDQRRIIEGASAETQRWVIDNLPTDREHAAVFCDQGGTLATATAADVEALIAATAPVIEQLREDPVTSTAIDALLALAPADVETPESCATAEAGADVVIDGTYEVTTTLADLEAGGVTDPEQLRQEVATVRFRFEGNAYRLDSVSDQELAQPSRSGRYTIVGNRFTLYWSGQPQDNTSADVEVLPDGSLHFTNVVSADPSYQALDAVKFGAHDWVRVE